MSNIIKTVKLQAGEQFNLPPGATLISATDTSAITSSCDIGTLEQLECYAFVFGNAALDGTNQQLFESTTFPVVGVQINNKYTNFSSPFNAKDNSSPVGQYDLANMVLAINNITGALILPKIGEHNEGTHGIIEFIVFKAIPSVAKTLQLKMIAATNQGFNLTENIEIWIKPRLHSELSAYSGLPTCP